MSLAFLDYKVALFSIQAVLVLQKQRDAQTVSKFLAQYIHLSKVMEKSEQSQCLGIIP